MSMDHAEALSCDAIFRVAVRLPVKDQQKAIRLLRRNLDHSSLLMMEHAKKESLPFSDEAIHRILKRTLHSLETTLEA